MVPNWESAIGALNICITPMMSTLIVAEINPEVADERAATHTR